MTERTKRTPKPVLAWGGFTNGRLHYGFRLAERSDTTPIVAVFCTRRVARMFYEDVRRVRVEIVEVSDD